MSEDSQARGPGAAWPSDGMESVDRCPLCDSDRRELLHEGLEDRIFFCAPGKWNLYSCEDCRCAYLDPRPTPETIGLAYERYFTHADGSDGDYESMNFRRKLRRRLANGYRNHSYGTKDKPASALGSVVTAMMPNGRAIIDAGIRHLPKALPGQRLLDLGCGNSVFLARARSAGWDVVGADFDAKAVKAARGRGLDVRLGGVEVFDPAAERFDVITMAHVIEHLHRPLDVLRACYELLNPGGFLWLETPNIESTGHRLYAANWRGLEPPRHLVLFSFSSMQHALANAGFAETEIQPYRPLCRSLFQASDAISRRQDPYSEPLSSLERGLLKKSEKTARYDHSRREFITLKAWKR